jgi:hypothetical protein
MEFDHEKVMLGAAEVLRFRLTRLGEYTVSWYWQKFGTVWSSILEERSKNCREMPTNTF